MLSILHTIAGNDESAKKSQSYFSDRPTSKITARNGAVKVVSPEKDTVVILAVGKLYCPSYPAEIGLNVA